MQILFLSCENKEVLFDISSTQVKHFKTGMRREYSNKEIMIEIEKIHQITVEFDSQKYFSTLSNGHLFAHLILFEVS